MAIPAAAIAKAAIGVLSNEKTRKAAGWVLVAILSPIILLIAAFCSILGGSADHNAASLTCVSMVAHYQQISLQNTEPTSKTCRQALHCWMSELRKSIA